MSMSGKDFEAFADYIRNSTEPITGKSAMIRMVIVVGKRSNPRFNTERFLASCRMPEPLIKAED